MKFQRSHTDRYDVKQKNRNTIFKRKKRCAGITNRSKKKKHYSSIRHDEVVCTVVTKYTTYLLTRKLRSRKVKILNESVLDVHASIVIGCFELWRPFFLGEPGPRLKNKIDKKQKKKKNDDKTVLKSNFVFFFFFYWPTSVSITWSIL